MWMMLVLGVMVLVLSLKSDAGIELDRLKERTQAVLKAQQHNLIIGMSTRKECKKYLSTGVPSDRVLNILRRDYNKIFKGE